MSTFFSSQASDTIGSSASSAKRWAVVARSLTLLALPILSGGLLALAFPPLDWSLLAWVALVPLAVALADRSGWVELYLGAYLGGLVFQLAHLDWIRTAYQGVGISGPRATQWLAQGIGLALFWPLAMFVGRAFVRKSRLPMAIALPIIWAAFEFSRKHLWAILDATGFPWGQLGLTQADYPRLIQIADLGGAYTVGMLVAAVNGAVFDAGRWLFARDASYTIARRRAMVSLGVAVVAVAGTFAYGTWRLSQAPTRLGPIVWLMPEATLGDLFDGPVDLERHAESAVSPSGLEGAIIAAGALGEPDELKRPELLLWSENVYPHVIEGPPPAVPTEPAPTDAAVVAASHQGIQRLERYARRVGAALVMGCERNETNGESASRYNSAEVVDPRRGYAGCYDKVFLVPFSEFQPVGRPSFGRQVTNPFVHGQTYPVFALAPRRPWEEGTTEETEQPYHFGAGICYDTCFPQHYRRYMNPADDVPLPDFFVVPSAERHDERLCLQRAILRLAQFRAVECRRAMVRNVNGGFSGIVDSSGRLLAAPPEIDFDRPVVLGRVPLDNRETLYARWGDWLPISACIAIALVILWPGRRTLSPVLRGRGQGEGARRDP